MSYFAYVPPAADEAGKPLAYNDPARSAPAPEIFSVLASADAPPQANPVSWAKALDAAAELIQSGSLADYGSETRYTVQINGHSNTGPATGPSFVGIQVHAVTATAS